MPGADAMKKNIFFLDIIVSIITVSLIFPFSASAKHRIVFTTGTFFGPGSMQDVDMPMGYAIINSLDEAYNGVTRFTNNGADKPGIDWAPFSPLSKSGLLSNGIEYNENLDGGVVDVGNGALKLLVVVTRDGPLNGEQLYRINKTCEWEIKTDLALDPGFAEGIIFAKELAITTGVVDLPLSIQTQRSIPGGVNAAGSLISGEPIFGRFGDYDMDGKLDGAFVGVANIPIDHMFYPGSPVAQKRFFESDIAISRELAAYVTLASLPNLFRNSAPPDKKATYEDRSSLGKETKLSSIDEVIFRLSHATRLLEVTGSKKSVIVHKINSYKNELEKSSKTSDLVFNDNENIGKLENILDQMRVKYRLQVPCKH